MIPKYREQDIRKLFTDTEDIIEIIKLSKGVSNSIEIRDVDFIVEVFDNNQELTLRELDDYFDLMEAIFITRWRQDCILEYGCNNHAWVCDDGCCSDSDYYSIVIRLK